MVDSDLDSTDLGFLFLRRWSHSRIWVPVCLIASVNVQWIGRASSCGYGWGACSQLESWTLLQSDSDWIPLALIAQIHWLTWGLSLHICSYRCCYVCCCWGGHVSHIVAFYSWGHDLDFVWFTVIYSSSISQPLIIASIVRGGVHLCQLGFDQFTQFFALISSVGTFAKPRLFLLYRLHLILFCFMLFGSRWLVRISLLCLVSRYYSILFFT